MTFTEKSMATIDTNKVSRFEFLTMLIGYKNPGDMGRHFEDIYELDPYNQRRGIYHGSKAYESVVGSLGDKRKGIKWLH